MGPSSIWKSLWRSEVSGAEARLAAVTEERVSYQAKGARRKGSDVGGHQFECKGDGQGHHFDVTEKGRAAKQSEVDCSRGARFSDGGRGTPFWSSFAFDSAISSFIVAPGR
jgi:hypothetical protein